MGKGKDFKNPACAFISEAETEQKAKPVKDNLSGDTIPTGYHLKKDSMTERMQLLVTPALKEGLKKEAKAQGGRSVNSLVNEVLEEYLKRKER